MMGNGRRIMTDWQPIETAPRDGTEVLLYDECGVTVGSFRADDNFPEDAPLWLDNSYDDFSCGFASIPVIATHWMPLPEPPK